MPAEPATSAPPPLPDYFALLGLPRHPWVDAAELKRRYHEAACSRHPDMPGGSQQRFILLGQAVGCLREVHSRLLHLVELEFPAAAGAKSGNSKPDAELFAAVGQALNEGRQAKKQLHAATTQLARTTALAEMNRALQSLRDALRQVRSLRENQERMLREAGAGWREKGAAFWKAEAARARYLAKWERELDEVLFDCENAVAIRRTPRS